MDVPRLWLSYSHKDGEWKDRILSRVDLQPPLQTWGNDITLSGPNLQERLRDQLEASSAALVLISPSFLDSRFLIEQELPLLLKRRARAPYHIVSVLVEPCEWRSIPVLAELSMFPPDGRALGEIPERELNQHLDELGREVRDIFTGVSATGFRETDEHAAALLFERLSPSSRRALGHAEGIRLALRQDVVHMEHLFAGLYEKEDGPTRAALTRANIDEAELSRIIDEATETRIPEKYAAPSLTRLPRHSPHVGEALSLAREIADTHPGLTSASRIRSRHLLYGALSITSCHVTRALLDRGVNRDAIPLFDGDGEVAQSVGEQRAEPAAPRRGVIAGYRSDDPDGRDLLEITKDVEALASVLAARDVAPPVSVGLFGDWGTGKTFFMRKLQAAIEARWMAARGAKGQSAYCENIVQLQFNAWHYIDTNLWASLTAEIFEKLARAVAADKRGPTADELRATAAQSRDAYTDAERRKGAADAELQEGEARLRRLTTDEASVVASLKPSELVREVHRFVVKNTGAGKQLELAARELNLPPVEATITDVKAGLLELHGIWGRMKALGMAIRNDSKQWVWGFLLAGVVCALAIPTVTWMLKDLPTIKNLGYAISVIVAAAAGLKPFFGPVKRALSLIEAARTAQHDLIERERTEKRKALEQERDIIRQKVSEAQRQVEEANTKLKSVERQLEEMRADRQMLDFIRRRHESADYTQHLGIIARARSDFENLSDLLARANRESARDGLPRVDRIILYIDDLDRCPEDKVVDVLQAVHLLLAFPLFVVVVGVDSRWLLHSLRLHSKAFQQLGTDEGVSDEERRHWRSTPLNYLEKIFQIPFTLRPMDSGGFGRLIDELSSGASKRVHAPATAQAIGAANPTGAPTSLAPTALSAPSSPAATSVAPGALSLSPAAAQNAAGNAFPATAPPMPPIELDPEYLRITDWERAYLKRLYPMMPSPRAVKRFVNVYRLLRASVDEKAFTAFVGDANDGHYRQVLMLLAVLTGYPTEATEMLRGLLEENHVGSWWQFVETFRSRAQLANGAQISASASSEAERWRQLLDKLNSLHALVPESVLCREFARWARDVARYSFESGRVLLIAGTEQDSASREALPRDRAPKGPA